MVVVQVARVDVLTHVLTTALVVAGLHVLEGVVVVAPVVARVIVTPGVMDAQIIVRDIVQQLVPRAVAALAKVIVMDSALIHAKTKTTNYWM